MKKVLFAVLLAATCLLPAASRASAQSLVNHHFPGERSIGVHHRRHHHPRRHHRPRHHRRHHHR